MATTTYFEADLPLGDESETTAKGKQTRKVEVFVSNFFGDSKIYLRIDDDEPGTIRLDKAEARAMLAGLDGAMLYLRY